MIKIKRGLDIPLAGAPSEDLDTAVTTRAAGLLGADYHGMKPTMAVQVGDVVKRGDLLFTDKKCEGVRYTSPAGGRVSAINRGAKRSFQSIVVEVDGDESTSFGQYSAEAARERLVQAGVRLLELEILREAKILTAAHAQIGGRADIVEEEIEMVHLGFKLLGNR